MPLAFIFRTVMPSQSSRSLRRVPTTFTIAATAVVSLHGAAPSGKKAFVDLWEDRAVIVTRTLYSIVFDERSRVVPLLKHEGRVSGLTMATPSGMYYQFDARRDSEDDIMARDPNQIVSLLRDQYRRSTHLEIGNVQDVEPVLLVRYEPGVELFVRKVQIERDRVRLLLHRERKGDLATTLTVEWPVPLSKELTESAVIEGVFSRFITRR